MTSMLNRRYPVIPDGFTDLICISRAWIRRGFMYEYELLRKVLIRVIVGELWRRSHMLIDIFIEFRGNFQLKKLRTRVLAVILHPRDAKQLDKQEASVPKRMTRLSNNDRLRP